MKPISDRKDRRMLHLDLSEEECAVLRELLSLRAQELKHEIHHTDSREFRGQLRHEQELVDRLSERLAVPVPVAAH
jgi:hypothetical protein